MSKYASILVAAYVGFFAVTASAIPVVSFSTDSTKNYMFLSTTQVSSCVASGVGNINGNTTAGNPSGIDDFLLNGGTAAGYTDALVAATYSVTSATVETDGTTTIIGAWSTGTTVVDAIGFKFGTGNTADEWFIYDLVDGVLSGSWTFIDMIAPGDGLDDGRISHMQTYCKDGCTTVLEPGMIGLLAIGLLCVVVARRKMRV